MATSAIPGWHAAILTYGSPEASYREFNWCIYMVYIGRDLCVLCVFSSCSVFVFPEGSWRSSGGSWGTSGCSLRSSEGSLGSSGCPNAWGSSAGSWGLPGGVLEVSWRSPGGLMEVSWRSPGGLLGGQIGFQSAQTSGSPIWTIS